MQIIFIQFELILKNDIDNKNYKSILNSWNN